VRQPDMLFAVASGFKTRWARTDRMSMFLKRNERNLPLLG
jgi:hypothetical protein